MPTGDEVSFGSVPSSSGAGYSPSSPVPSLYDVIRWAEDEGMDDNENLVVVAIGDLGSPGAKNGISRKAIVTDVKSLKIASQIDVKAGRTTMTSRWGSLLRASPDFRHVQAVVVRPL